MQPPPQERLQGETAEQAKATSPPPVQTPTRSDAAEGLCFRHGLGGAKQGCLSMQDLSGTLKGRDCATDQYWKQCRPAVCGVGD